MRLPIVQYPLVVYKSLGHFGSVFQSPEQCKHFCEYVTGLMAGDKGTVQAINNLFLDRNDQSALNKFLTQAKWDETELNRMHGTAPDIAGKNIINPTAMLLSGVMLLEHLGYEIEAAHMEAAIYKVYQDGKYLTRDQGGSASTTEFCETVRGNL